MKTIVNSFIDQVKDRYGIKTFLAAVAANKDKTYAVLEDWAIAENTPSNPDPIFMGLKEEPTDYTELAYRDLIQIARDAWMQRADADTIDVLCNALDVIRTTTPELAPRSAAITITPGTTFDDPVDLIRMWHQFHPDCNVYGRWSRFWSC